MERLLPRKGVMFNRIALTHILLQGTMLGGGGDLQMLSSMLQESQQQEEEREEQNRVATMGPGDIGPKKSPAEEKPAKKVDPNAIWDEDEVDEGRILNKVDKGDKRERSALSHSARSSCAVLHMNAVAISGQSMTFGIDKTSRLMTHLEHPGAFKTTRQ